MAEIIIDDSNFQQFINPTVDGETKVCGTVPRDLQLEPHGSKWFAPPFDLPLIPESEWQARLDAQKAAKAQLSDIRNIGMEGKPIPSRDQNQKGYCVPPGTMVEMANGSRKPIECIVLSDRVLTYDPEKGALAESRVGQLHQRLFTGSMVSLCVEGMDGALVATDEHPIYCPITKSGKSSGLWRKDHDLLTVQNGQVKVAKVRKVLSKDVRDIKVYDIGVEDTHLFFPNGILSRNCWAHSGVSAHLICRALMNEPYADLSAFAVAAMVKGFRDEGGWGSEGIDFQASKGCPTSEFWPQKSMSRSNDNPNTWTNAALHKYIQWRDLDPNQMKQQLVTCLLLGFPVVSDFDWWCFPPGTLIRMADGTERAIEKIMLGEQVVSASGNVREVRTLYKRMHNGGLKRIVLHGNNTLQVTPNHKLPVLRDGQIVELQACDLKNTDYVRVPKYIPQERLEYLHVYDLIGREKVRVSRQLLKKLSLAGLPDKQECRYLSQQYGKLTKRDKEETKGNVTRWGRKVKLPDLLRLDYKLGRFFGLWLAEGGCSEWHCSWSFHEKELETLGKEVIEFIEGIGGRVVIGTTGGKGIGIREKGTNLCQLIAALFRGNVYTKSVHEDLFRAPDEFLRGLLFGWLDGDGTLRGRGKEGVLNYTGCSVSKTLALNMFDIAHHLGYNPHFTVEGPSSFSTKKCKKYKVGFPLERSKVLCAKSDYRLKQYEGHTYRRVKKVEDIPYDGAVYNIEVEEDHSYIAQGIGVHNSHSVCTIDLVSVNPFQTRIWNSWGDVWSENGTGILEGRKAIPNGAWAALVITPSQN